jgi:hypothetical protein
LGEAGWHISYVDVDGEKTEVLPGPDGIYRDAHAQPLGRLLPNGALVLDTRNLLASAARKREPQLCPIATPDKYGQGPGSRSKAYEDQMKALLNQPPTPSDYGRALANPSTTSGIVNFDDCWLKDGTMYEYKGPTYARLIEKSTDARAPWDFRKDWLDQSLRQIETASLSGRDVIRVFAEQEAANYAYRLFQAEDLGREKITIAVFPYVEGK